MNDTKEQLSKRMRGYGQYLISDKEFDDQLLQQTSIVKQQMKHKKGFIPQLVVLTNKEADGKHGLIMCLLPDMPQGDEKKDMLMGVGAKMAEEKYTPVAAFFMSEAWVKHLSAEEQKLPTKAPSEYADKQENLLVQGLTIDQRMNMATMVMRRTKSNFVKLGEASFIECNHPHMKEIKSYLLESFWRGYVIRSHDLLEEKRKV